MEPTRTGARKVLSVTAYWINFFHRIDDPELHLAQALLKSGDKDGAKRALGPLLTLPAGTPMRAEAEKLLGGG